MYKHFIVCNSENMICNLKKMLQLKKADLPLLLSLCNSTELFYNKFYDNFSFLKFCLVQTCLSLQK